MTMKLSLLLFSALGLGLGACRPSLAPPPEPPTEAAPDVILRPAGGGRWRIQEDMRAELSRIERDLRAFDEAGNPDPAAFAEALAGGLSRFVALCQMEGPAHEELHKWLIPLLGHSEALSSASGPGEREAILREVRGSLARFHEFFE